MSKEIPVSLIQEAVLDWYQANGRHDLPWRNWQAKNLPYRVLVAEFMLQQTQVERVVPKFNAFLAAYPTIQALSLAPTAQVITLWQGLGYNRRAVLLHAAAKMVASDYQGHIPTSPQALVQLPGIGAYTSAAISAFAFNKPVVVIDTNIQRFYELLIFGYATPSQTELREVAGTFIPDQQSRVWHSALMDLTSGLRAIQSPQGQQQLLLELLKLAPTWPLPALNHEPLHRPKQSRFSGSKRFYRGRIVAFLSGQTQHTASFGAVEKYLQGHNISSQYSIESLIVDLQKDGLLIFNPPLNAETCISLVR